MHSHDGLTIRSYLVTLRDVHHQTHQIQVDTPCTCDMWPWVNALDLPFRPDFMDVEEVVDTVPERVASD
jgi:hypothetical protein